MKRQPFAISAAVAATLAGCEVAEPAVQAPNIIYILADDLGYGDIGVLGQKTIPTPNIDRMAREGMIFTNHHSGAPVSAPSRCVLMTGKHTGHSSIRGNKSISQVGVAPLWPSDATLPEAIGNGTDYVTGMCGRWHLGGELTNQTPWHRGFDYHFGKLSADFRNLPNVMVDALWDEGGKHVPYAVYSERNVEAMFCNGEYYDLSPEEQASRPVNMDRLVTDKAKGFIRNNLGNPFFLYVAYSLVHAPLEYHDATPVEASDWPEVERAFASMLMSLDKYVGEIIDEVDRLGIADNTLIVFTSDNGPHGEGGHDHEFFDSNGDMRGFKRDLYLGGTRVPMIARWKGTVAPGSQTGLLSAFWDVMPTICDLAGAPPPECTDGISFAPTLLGQPQQEKHEYLYWEFNERSSRSDPGAEYKQSVLTDDWKAIHYLDRGTVEFYELEGDGKEIHDTAADHPREVARALEWMKNSHVQNPIFPMTREERNEH